MSAQREELREEICDELEVDLCLARLELVEARRRLRGAPTAANRAAVAGAGARLDVILDLLVELRSAGPAPPAGSRTAVPGRFPRPGVRRSVPS